jgi:GT2 family glycosyltransferase
MNDTVDVTISIVTGASAQLANRCLDVFKQDVARAISLDIVVLDNASSDGTADRIAEGHPEVRVIRQDYRAGFGANHNTIIRSTQSRYVYVVNDDTETPAGVLEEIVAYMDAHPRCAVAGPRIIGADGKQQPSAWRLMTLWVQLVWALSLGQRGAVVSRGSVPRIVGAVSGCAMLVRRDALEAVGCFDERYFMFSEEADLAQRLRGMATRCTTFRTWRSCIMAKGAPSRCRSGESMNTGDRSGSTRADGIPGRKQRSSHGLRELGTPLPGSQRGVCACSRAVYVPKQLRERRQRST